MSMEIVIKQMISANKDITKIRGRDTIKVKLNKTLATIIEITIETKDISVFPNTFPKIINPKSVGVVKICDNVPFIRSRFISPAEEKQILLHRPIKPEPSIT